MSYTQFPEPIKVRLTKASGSWNGKIAFIHALNEPVYFGKVPTTMDPTQDYGFFRQEFEVLNPFKGKK